MQLFPFHIQYSNTEEGNVMTVKVANLNSRFSILWSRSVYVLSIGHFENSGLCPLVKKLQTATSCGHELLFSPSLLIGPNIY